jgi:putative acetyltransferase
MQIALDSPRSAGVAELCAAADAFALSLYPPENYHSISLADLEAPRVAFFTARDDERLVGMLAVVDAGDGTVELKRMFVAASARGLGIAGRLLATAEEHARGRGMTVARLETGVQQPAAIALYAKHGYLRIPNFGDYVNDPTSYCMEKRLAP